VTVTWIAGCGDLGLATAELLLAAGHRVVGLRRQPPARGGPSGLAWAAADLTRSDTLAAIEGCPDQVIYAAAAPDRTEAAYRATYVEGLQNLGAVVGGAAWTALAVWTGGVVASIGCHAAWTALMILLPPVPRAEP
jgi:NAD(P)-dependent dehydrogenase (short-subunit alcohol dehydrogenase family)